MMELSLRCRHWSVLQVVAIVVCCRGNVLSESSTKDSNLFLDVTTTTTDFQTKEGSDQNVNEHDENVTHEDRSDNPLILPAVMTTVCLVLLIAIVVFVVIMRRKKWPKVSGAVEMTHINNDSSDRKEAIYANENQTMSLDNGNGCPIYSNDRIEKFRDKGAKETDTYKVPNKAFYNLADDAGSRPTEDQIVYCDVESREPAYQEPRPQSHVYSFARVAEEPECTGSAADASNVDNNVYCEVKTKEPANAANSSAQNDYNEAVIWKQSEYKRVKADQTIPPAQEKKTDNSSHKAVPDTYTKVNKPSKNAAAFDSPGKVEAQDIVTTSCVFPNPLYETMSHVMPESIYTNDPTPSPRVLNKRI